MSYSKADILNGVRTPGIVFGSSISWHDSWFIERKIINNIVEKATYSDNMQVLCQGRNLNIWIGFIS